MIAIMSESVQSYEASVCNMLHELDGFGPDGAGSNRHVYDTEDVFAVEQECKQDVVSVENVLNKLGVELSSSSPSQTPECC